MRIGSRGISTRNKVAAGLISVAAAGTLVAYGLSDSGTHSSVSTTASAADAPTSASPTAAPTDSPSPSAGVSSSPSASASGSASASAGASHSPSPSRSATHGATPVPGNKTTTAAAAPPPPAPVAKPGPVAPAPPGGQRAATATSCKTTNGAAAPQSAVAAALTASAGKTRTLTLASGGKDTLPPLPVNLLKAIAWQESGWQSNIVACDGGIGTMQLMPGTVTWMNGKFGVTNDVQTLTGNTELGAELLDELVAYYGDSDFGGKYDLGPDPVTGKNPLLDLVIAAYNAGAGNVHYTTTTVTATPTPTSTDPAAPSPSPVTTTTGTSVIPNPSYVANVKALMGNCACLNF